MIRGEGTAQEMGRVGSRPVTGHSIGFVGIRTKGEVGGGLHSVRNCNYDPKTGRFTQEDPIGLAGGLNLYGFAGGDPVTYSDPFGLCPWPPSSCLQDLANWGAQRGGAIGSLALNAGAAGAALFEVSSGADIENAVEALGEGRYLAAGALR